MQVILLERVENLGSLGDTVNVKPGFARNYLLPRKKALRANKDNLAYFETKRAELEALNAKRRDEAVGISGKLEGFKLLLIRQAGEGGQLYGSVSSRDVADELRAKGHKIERNNVSLNSPIKALGVYPVAVRLYGDVKSTVEVTVARSTEEAESLKAAQAASLLERAEDAEKLIQQEGGAKQEGEAKAEDAA